MREGAELVGMTVLPQGSFPALEVSLSDEESLSKPLDEEGDSSDSDEEGEAASEEDGKSQSGPWLLLVSKKGLGKRVRVSEIRTQRRGGSGSRAIKLNEGDELAAAQVVPLPMDGEDTSAESLDVLISTVNGISIRTPLKSIRVFRRQSKGHHLVSLGEGDAVAGVTIVSSADKA